MLVLLMEAVRGLLAGRDLQKSFKFSRCLRLLLLLIQGKRKSEVCGSVVRLEHESVAKLRSGLLVMTEVIKRPAKLGARTDGQRIELHCLPHCGDRFVASTECTQANCVYIVRKRVAVRVLRQQFAKIPLGSSKIPVVYKLEIGPTSDAA